MQARLFVNRYTFPGTAAPLLRYDTNDHRPAAKSSGVFPIAVLAWLRH
jgi:hypothetical protein